MTETEFLSRNSINIVYIPKKEFTPLTSHIHYNFWAKGNRIPFHLPSSAPYWNQLVYLNAIIIMWWSPITRNIDVQGNWINYLYMMISIWSCYITFISYKCKTMCHKLNLYYGHVLMLYIDFYHFMKKNLLENQKVRCLRFWESSHNRFKLLLLLVNIDGAIWSLWVIGSRN